MVKYASNSTQNSCRTQQKELFQLIAQLMTSLKELDSDWAADSALYYCKKLYAAAEKPSSLLAEALSLLSVCLLFGHTMCLHDIKFRTAHSQSLAILLTKGFSKLFQCLGGKVSVQSLSNFTRNNVVFVFKNAVNSFIDQCNPLPVETGSKLLLLIELTSYISRTPFLLIAQALYNTLKGSNSITPCFTSTEVPFLPSYQHKDYTLVLDLDETLGHLTPAGFSPRPYSTFLIKELSQSFEMVCFTAGSKAHAESALSVVDPDHYILLVLSHSHTREMDGGLVKDLRLLGRDLRKTIIVDNLIESFRQQPENGVLISSWVGDMNDVDLFRLTEFLVEIPRESVDDVRGLLELNKTRFA